MLGAFSVFEESSLPIVDFLETFRPQNRLIIVRNPWARLASAYDDKIIDKHWQLKVIYLLDFNDSVLPVTKT